MTWKPYEPKPREPYAEAPAIGSAASADFPRDKVVQIPRSDLKALLTVDDCLKTTEAQAACIRGQQAEIDRLNGLLGEQQRAIHQQRTELATERRTADGLASRIDTLNQIIERQQDEIKALKMSAAYAEGHEDVSPSLGTVDLTDDAPKEPESILLEAHRLVHGDRGADYGHPLDNHGLTAAFWSLYVDAQKRTGITARDVCWMNILQKCARDTHHPKRDNLTDTAGYAENGQMIADEEKRRGLA
ncbi:MAG: DUF6378 domain-containing protein [Burkholderiales bacterium]|nr:DUF6378 domain-containing protein [Burkholderiales bacterium]